MLPIFFWLIAVFACAIAFFIFRSGILRSRTEIEFIGGSSLFCVFVAVTYLKGWVGLLILIAVFWLLITPVVEMLIRSLNKPAPPKRKRLSKAGQEALIEYLRKIGQIRD